MAAGIIFIAASIRAAFMASADPLSASALRFMSATRGATGWCGLRPHMAGDGGAFGYAGLASGPSTTDRTQMMQKATAATAAFCLIFTL
jgi:hypothetical protein